MRIVAVLGLLAGCNWAFGLGDTSLQPGDATLLAHVELDYQLLPAANATPQIVPIPELTTVQIGPVGSMLHDVVVDDNGLFVIPFELLGVTYRMVFTVPGETVPREVVWTGIDNAHYTIPFFGRLDRGTPPSDSVITFGTNPVNPPGFGQPRIFTTGLWSTAILGAQTNPVSEIYTSTVPGSPATSSPLGGPLGVLGSQDAIWLFDYMSTGGSTPTTTPLGFAQGTVTLGAGMSTVTPAPTWMTPGPSAVAFSFNGTNASFDNARLKAALSGHFTPEATTIAGGVTPSFAMPATTKPSDDASADDGVFFPLATTFANSLPTSIINPFGPGPDSLPLAVRWRVASARVLDGPMMTVTSGLQDIADAAATDPLLVAAGIATTISIQDGSQNSPTDLNGDDVATGFQTVKMSGTTAVALTFTIDQRADACLITVFEIGPSSLIPTRSIDLISPLVTPKPNVVSIDPTAFMVGQDHIIRITCRTGYLSTALLQGKLDAITYPFSSSTHFVEAFHTAKP